MNEVSPHASDQVQEVLEKYSLMIYRLAFAQTKTRHDTDDIYQEVFLRLVKANPSFENEEHRKAWLIRVTINCCKSFWQSSWRRHTALVAPGEYAEKINPEETRNDLHDALSSLPMNSRAIIHLFYYEGMPVKKSEKP